MSSRTRRFGFVCLILTPGVLVCLAAEEVRTTMTAPRWRQHDIRRPKPPVVEPSETSIASKPPQDATILFEGSNLDAWKSLAGGPAEWKVVGDHFEVAPGTGGIETKEKFGDIQLHVEWSAPNPPHGKGQDRGNSGIFLMGQFEIQVLDSYHADTYADGFAGRSTASTPPCRTPRGLPASGRPTTSPSAAPGSTPRASSSNRR